MRFSTVLIGEMFEFAGQIYLRVEDIDRRYSSRRDVVCLTGSCRGEVSEFPDSTEVTGGKWKLVEASDER